MFRLTNFLIPSISALTVVNSQTSEETIPHCRRNPTPHHMTYICKFNVAGISPQPAWDSPSPNEKVASPTASWDTLYFVSLTDMYIFIKNTRIENLLHNVFILLHQIAWGGVLSTLLHMISILFPFIFTYLI